MKIVGTFQAKALRNQSSAAQKKSGFSARPAFRPDRNPSEDNVTALFAVNSFELKRLYTQATGKTPDNQVEDNTVAVAFHNRILPRKYWAGELWDNSESGQEDDWLSPLRRLPSNQNVQCAVR